MPCNIAGGRALSIKITNPAILVYGIGNVKSGSRAAHTQKILKFGFLFLPRPPEWGSANGISDI